VWVLASVCNGTSDNKIGYFLSENLFAMMSALSGFVALVLAELLNFWVIHIIMPLQYVYHFDYRDILQAYCSQS